VHLGEGWLAQTVHPYELYLMVRMARPQVVVETGVASGFSTTFILQALEDNGAGRLYSIDLPNSGMRFLPEGRGPGWVVPERLRTRWTLILGKTFEKLVPLLEELHALDVFLHDSEHTYEAMTYEYEASWPFIKPGGFLLSDDVGKNEAFTDFCRKKQRIPVVLNGRFGIVRKEI